MTNRRRLWRAENQDISIKQEGAREIFTVNGTRGIDYRVELNVPSCSCPDWEKESPDGGCKHILKVKLEEGIIDPLPSAKTDYDGSSTRQDGTYSTDWEKLSQQTRRRDNWQCQYCNAKGGAHGNTELHAHHIVPKSKGGKDRSGNLITLCKNCHEREHGHSISSQERTQSGTQSSEHRDFGQGSQNPGTSATQEEYADHSGPIPEKALQEKEPSNLKDRQEPDPPQKSQENTGQQTQDESSMEKYLNSESEDKPESKSEDQQDPDTPQKPQGNTGQQTQDGSSMEKYLNSESEDKPESQSEVNTQDTPRESPDLEPSVDTLAWVNRRKYARLAEIEPTAKRESSVEPDSKARASDTNQTNSGYLCQATEKYPSNWDALRQQTYERDEFVCQNCGAKTANTENLELHAHYVVPLPRRGNNVPNNLTTLCSTCHETLHTHLE